MRFFVVFSLNDLQVERLKRINKLSCNITGSSSSLEETFQSVMTIRSSLEIMLNFDAYENFLLNKRVD